MTGEEEWRHPEPVRPKVKSTAKQLAAFLTPAIARQQPRFEPPVADAADPDETGIDGS